ncbi:MAG: hypothetical protein P1U56_15560 [Saprospiraceae bacterium]|nr:hypothetical protein [Saprospiraceae bacterium]
MDNYMIKSGWKCCFQFFFICIGFCLCSLTNAHAQSDFYKNNSYAHQKGKEDRSTIYTHQIGNLESENGLRSTNLKKVVIGSLSVEKATSRSTLSEILNSNPSVTQLDVSRLSSNYNLLSLDVEKLKYVQHIRLTVQSDFNFDLFWNKLNQIKSLEEIHIEKGRRADLQFTPEFNKLLGKIKRLAIVGLKYEMPSDFELKHNLETLVVRRLKGSKENQGSLLSCFGDAAIQELIIDEVAELKDDQVAPLSLFSDVKFLDLASGKVKETVPIFSFLSPSIIELNLRMRYNKIVNDEGLDQLKNLKVLNIKAWRTAKPMSFQHIEQLDKLEVLTGNFTNVTEGITNLKKLKILDIGGDITSASFLPHLKSLRTVRIVSEQLEIFPEDLGNLKHLESFEIQSSHLNKFPKGLCRNKKLKRLVLIGDIKEVPACIGNLSQLTYLDLSGNPLNRIPTTIRKLTQLETLLIRQHESNSSNDSGEFVFKKAGCDVMGIPHALFEIKNLNLVDLSNTEITTPQLEHLLKGVIKADCPSLEVKLARCGIEKLPDLSYRDIRIDKLDLSENNLAGLPKSFYFIGVNEFDLGGNALSFNELNKDFLLVYGYISNELSKDDFTKMDSIPWLIKKEKNASTVIKLLELAHHVDSLTTTQIIEPYKLGDYHFFKENYALANYFYGIVAEKLFLTLSNKKNRTGGVSILWNRYAFSLKKKGEKEKLVQLLEFIENFMFEKLKEQDQSGLVRNYYVPLVYMNIFYQGIDDEKSTYFANLAAKYLSEKRESDEASIGNVLDFLELCIVSNRFELFDQHYFNALTNYQKTEKDDFILEYLKIVKDIATGKLNYKDVERFRSMSKTMKVMEEWEVSMVEMWAVSLSPKNQMLVKECNRLLNPWMELVPFPLVQWY